MAIVMPASVATKAAETLAANKAANGAQPALMHRLLSNLTFSISCTVRARLNISARSVARQLPTAEAHGFP